MKQLLTLLFLALSVQLFAHSYPITSITISLPTSSDAVTYKIKIVEIKGDQSPENAFRTNKPIFEKDSIELLKIPYPSSAAAFVSGKQYVWNVQALNRERKPIGTNNGRSEFFTFKALF